MCVQASLAADPSQNTVRQRLQALQTLSHTDDNRGQPFCQAAAESPGGGMRGEGDDGGVSRTGGGHGSAGGSGQDAGGGSGGEKVEGGGLSRSGGGGGQEEAESERKRGVEAYRGRRLEEALEHFSNAVRLQVH
jgi:hypothetical protein